MKGIIQPGSVWCMKSDDYIQGTPFPKRTEVKIETIQIDIKDAFIIFMYGTRRMMVEANRFRSKFEFVEFKEEKQ